MKNKECHNVGRILKSNSKIVERVKINTPDTKIQEKEFENTKGVIRIRNSKREHTTK